MKTLYIHRHAKSDWDSGAKSDHDRPLNKRGKMNGQFMAERFKEEHRDIDLLMSSTAKRALNTMRYYQDQLDIPDSKIKFERKIYGAGVYEMMKILEGISDEYEYVMIFGHNPTFSDLSSYLDKNFSDHLVTCARVKVELDIDSWKEISSNCGEVKELVFPKQFPEMRE